MRWTIHETNINDPDVEGWGCFATVVLGFLTIVGFSLQIAWDMSDNHDGDFFYFILIALVMLAAMKLHRDENRKRREELRKIQGEIDARKEESIQN